MAWARVLGTLYLKMVQDIILVAEFLPSTVPYHHIDSCVKGRKRSRRRRSRRRGSRRRRRREGRRRKIKSKSKRSRGRMTRRRSRRRRSTRSSQIPREPMRTSFTCLKDVVKDIVIIGVLSERRRIVKNK